MPLFYNPSSPTMRELLPKEKPLVCSPININLRSPRKRGAESNLLLLLLRKRQRLVSILRTRAAKTEKVRKSNLFLLLLCKRQRSVSILRTRAAKKNTGIEPASAFALQKTEIGFDSPYDGTQKRTGALCAPVLFW